MYVYGVDEADFKLLVLKNENLSVCYIRPVF